MSGRGRLEIGTYGDISTIRTGNGTVRAEARYRDGDGIVRKVTATAATAKQAKQSLRLKLQRRNTATGFGVALSPESTVAELAEAWIEDVRVRSDLAAGTKDLYWRELNSLVLPTFKTFRLHEVTTGRVDQFLKRQSLVSYAHARHSRVVLNLMFNYALRHDALHRNPVAGTARLKQPVSKPVALGRHRHRDSRSPRLRQPPTGTPCAGRANGRACNRNRLHLVARQRVLFRRVGGSVPGH